MLEITQFLITDYSPPPMPIHVALYHKTHYSYDRPTGHGAPMSCGWRACHRIAGPGFSVIRSASRGGEHFVNWQQDPFLELETRGWFSPDKMKEFQRGD